MPKTMTPEEEQRLQDWIREVAATIGVDPATVPVTDLLELAGAVSKGVARPAVPITGYLAGYAAALSAASPQPSDPGTVVQGLTDLVPAPAAEAGGDAATR